MHVMQENESEESAEEVAVESGSTRSTRRSRARMSDSDRRTSGGTCSRPADTSVHSVEWNIRVQTEEINIEN